MKLAGGAIEESQYSQGSQTTIGCSMLSQHRLQQLPLPLGDFGGVLPVRAVETQTARGFGHSRRTVGMRL